MANTAELNIWVKLKDDATKALTGINGTIDKLQPTFQKMSLVGVAGLGAIGAAAYKTVKDFGDADKAMKMLEHTTINIAKGTMENVKALSALADAEQRRGVLDADAIRTGQAQLMTFGLSTEMVSKLTQSMSDLAVNQFGVNASSEDLTNTANIMAKALNGQFGVLEKSGIRFTEAQRNMIQFGNETERTSALQEGLAQNLKFTNEVALKTFEGQMAKVNTQIGDISENIGAALMPAITSILEKVGPIVEKFVAWSAENPKLITTIAAIAAGIFALLAVVGTLGIAIPAIVAGFAALGTAATAVGAAFTFMLGPIGLIIIAIAALVAAGVLIYKNWEEISAFAMTVWNGIVSTITTALQAVADVFTSIWEGIKAAFWGYINFIVGLVATLLDALFPNWQAALMALWNSAVAIWESIKAVFLSAFEAVKGVFLPFLESLKTAWDTVWNGIKETFISIWEAISGVFDAAISGIKSAMETLMSPIQKVIDLAERAISLAGGAIKSAGGKISSAVKAIVDKGSSITGKKAGGGNVRMGSSYIVGERGPEMLVPGFNGSIIPNHALAGGGITVVISNNKFVSPKDEARAMGGELVKYLKDNMRL